MTFHAPRKIKPSVGLLADEFPEPWLRISQVEAEQGDLRGRHRPPLRAIPGFSLPTSCLDRRVELPTIGIVSIRGVALCPLSEAYDDLRRFWPTCTYGGRGAAISSRPHVRAFPKGPARWTAGLRACRSCSRERARGAPTPGRIAWRPRTSPASTARRSASRPCRRRHNRSRPRAPVGCFVPTGAYTCPGPAPGPPRPA